MCFPGGAEISRPNVSVWDRFSDQRAFMSYSYIITEIITKTADNAFIGTLSAGAVLAFFGFRFYLKQKQIDIEFEDLRKLKDSAATLFAAINSASNKIGGLFNMYDQENPTLTKILKHVDISVEDGLNKKTGKELEVASATITALWENLNSQLTIKNQFGVEIDTVSQTISILNMYMIGASITLRKLKPEEVKEWRQGWKDIYTSLVVELSKVLK